MKKKVCVFTGTRAEYGLLRPLMDQIRSDDDMQLQIIVSGMHLSRRFGMTYKEIEKDGFKIDAKVDIRLKSDDPVDLAGSTALCLSGCAKAYASLKPDITVILGDRFEAFAAAAAATLMRIPIAHLHGGEATFGLIDEAIRHSITKMSHLHFTATEHYRKRVIQLGEDPARVFNVGAIGIDNIRNMKLLTKDELERELGLSFNKHNFLVTFHPVTLEKGTASTQFDELLKALDGREDTNIIFTKSNADTGGKDINDMIDGYVKKNRGKAAAFTSMGQLKYLSTMQFVDAVVGNSSSGLIEAPSFHTATVNIGDRQNGRIKADSVMDCPPVESSIRGALDKVCSQGFKRNIESIANPYGDGNASVRIKEILKGHETVDILKKGFFDMTTRGEK